MHKQRLFIVVAAAIGIVAAFLPWISITIFGVSIKANGISGDAGSGGFITLGLCAAAIGLAVSQGDRNQELDAKMKKAVAGIGGAIIGYMLYYLLVRMEAQFGFAGMGVWLTIVAGIAVLAMPFVIKGDGNFEMPNKETIKADLDADGDGDGAGE